MRNQTNTSCGRGRRMATGRRFAQAGYPDHRSAFLGRYAAGGGRRPIRGEILAEPMRANSASRNRRNRTGASAIDPLATQSRRQHPTGYTLLAAASGRGSRFTSICSRTR